MRGAVFRCAVVGLGSRRRAAAAGGGEMIWFSITVGVLALGALAFEWGRAGAGVNPSETDSGENECTD